MKSFRRRATEGLKAAAIIPRPAHAYHPERWADSANRHIHFDSFLKRCNDAFGGTS